MLASIFHAFGITCFAIAWLAYDHYRPWVNFHSETLALLGIGLLALSQCLRDRGVATAPRMVLGIILMAIVPWIQYLVGIEFFAGDALITSLYLHSFGVAIWLGYCYAKSDGDSDGAPLVAIFFALWIVALISAAIGLLQWLNLQAPLGMYVVQTDAGSRALGNLGQPNQLATLLIMGIAALAWTFERNRIGLTGLIVGVGFMTFVLTITQSRAGIVSAGAVGLFAVWKTSKNSSRIKPLYVLIWLAACGLLVMSLPMLYDVMLMGSARDLNMAVDSPRMIIWKQVLSGIFQSPWLGYGWNQTPAAHTAGSLEVLGTYTYTNAHSIILDLVAWNGIPVGLFLTTTLAYWLISRFFKLHRTNAIYAAACLMPVAVHSLVEFPFAYSYFLLAVGLMVGVVEASYSRGRSFVVNIRWVMGPLVIWFALGVCIVYEYFLVEEDFRVVRFENFRIGTTPEEYKMPNVWLLTQMGAMLRASRQQADSEMSLEELENLRKVSLRFPYGALSLRYALALGLNGDAIGASRQMAIIRGMYGEYYYQAAIDVMRDLQEKKYPELSLVILP